MKWEFKIAKKAGKQTKKFPKNDLRRISESIEELGEDPYNGDIQKMSGEENVWRKRVGNYRILYEIIFEEKIIFIFSVERRTTTTYKK